MHFSENYAIILSVLSASLPDTKRISAWGISTVGSARHSHCRGQEFESPMLHGRSRLKSLDLFFCFQTSRKKSRPDGGFPPCPVGFCLRILLATETLPGRGQRFFTPNQHSRITNLLKANECGCTKQNTTLSRKKLQWRGGVQRGLKSPLFHFSAPSGRSLVTFCRNRK